MTTPPQDDQRVREALARAKEALEKSRETLAASNTRVRELNEEISRSREENERVQEALDAEILAVVQTMDETLFSFVKKTESAV